MFCSGFKPMTAQWKSQTDPLDYGGPIADLILFGDEEVFSHSKIFFRTNCFKMILKLWQYCSL